MRINEIEFEKEKKYLQITKDVIKKLISERTEEINNKRMAVVENKKHLWQNLREYSDAEMYNTMDDEDLNVSIINSEIIKVARLERSLETPYFGRVDFKTDNTESIYIGLTSVSKDNTDYVCDWRAKAANLYYNYGLGQVEYETQDGIISGEVTLKRQFKIEMGSLLEVFDSDVALEDEMLQEILLSSSDDKMKNIVSTIQKEQNEVIRFLGKKDLIIDGTAGSGKTSVALHRIAYLLYNRKDLTNKNVLIFSPNDVFTNYISDVLPELGEENVKTITFKYLASKIVPNYELQSAYDFIENFYRNGLSIDENTSFKFKNEYQNKIDTYIKNFIDNLVFTKKIGLKKGFTESSELNYLFKVSASKLNLCDRIEFVAEKLCDKYRIDVNKNVPKLIGIIKNLLGLNKDAVSLYREFLKNDTFAENGIIPYEDIGGMLYLYFEINGYPVQTHIKHVVIDEAQDYTPLEFRIIKNIFKSAQFTILGDKNQVINPYLKYNTLEEVGNIFSSAKYYRLSKTYRSSNEIISFANKILHLNDVECVRVPTNTPVIKRFSEDIKSIDDDLMNLINSYKRIAVITKTYEETEELYSKLDKTHIRKVDENISKPVTITPAYLAKGLEFDAVIVYTNIKGKFMESEANLYYVAVTRAQHKLIVYNQNM